MTGSAAPSVAPIPYGRLAAAYACYFASLGAIMPYWGLFLTHEGFAPPAVGQLIAVLAGAKIIAPYLWGWLADRTGANARLLRFAAVAAFVSFAGILGVTSWWGYAVILAAFGFFWHALLPQLEALTLNHLGASPHRYSTIRLWGSLGFIVAVVGLGALQDQRPLTELPQWILPWLGGLMIVVWLLPSAGGIDPGSQRASSPEVRPGAAGVVGLLFVSFLMQLSHGPYYTFYSVLLEASGHGGSVTGRLWALGVLAEVVAFLFVPRLLSRLGAVSLLRIALASTVLRWLLIGYFADQLPGLIVAQLLHAASYGLYHAAAIHLIHSYFVGAHQVRGQALYSSLSFGLGGALGSLIAGYLWSIVGSTLTFYSAAGAAALGWLATRWLTGPADQPPASSLPAPSEPRSRLPLESPRRLS